MPGKKQLSRQRTANLFKKTLKKCLKSPEKLTVSQWAEKYRDLGNTSAISGKWSNDMTPYLVGIMDAFSDPYIQEINFVKPTQVGGTECMNNMIGYAITQSPAPMMMVYPTDEAAKDMSKDRIVPSLTMTEAIKEVYDEKKSKQQALKFKGMTLYITGAGNPNKVASKPVKYLFFDEIDKLPGASQKEASPYNLARERTRTYPYSKKIYTCCTPTLKTNYVWKIHEAAEAQKEFFVPCPHCGSYFVFNFHQIKYSEDKSLSNEERASTAEYVCKECGCTITDKDKIKILRKGIWKDTKKKGNGKPRTVSFHLNCLVSRFLTWKDIALEFLNSHDDPEQLQNFVNSWLAEPWEETKVNASVQTVLDRQTDTPELVVPDWAKMLTGGVDVQENCVYWTIRAWGDHITSQNIAHGQALSLNEVETIMNYDFKKQNGDIAQVELCLIDSGDQTDDVYEFVAYNLDWALPCKGSSHAMIADFKISKINKENSKAYGQELVIIDTGKYKDKIASRLQRKNGQGSWMVFRGCDETYARQVTAEHKVTARNGKRVEKVWVQKTSHADNHYLDAEVYAFCAAEIKGVKYLYLEGKEETEVAPVQQQSDPADDEWLTNNNDWLGE